MLPQVHEALAKRGLLPSTHYVDAGYTEAGVREVQTTDRHEAGAPREARVPAGDEFSALAASFPTASPDRIPIRHVAWLGLEPVLPWQSQVRGWLLPKALDSRALDAAVRDAFAARFELDEARRVPEPVQASLASVRAFGTERPDVALVNDELGVDAVLVSRFAPAEAEGLFDPPGGGVLVEVRLASGRQ
jgi:hypothetical protein